MAIIVEDFVPYDQSIQWRLTQAYYEQRGIRAWTQGDLPFQATCNYPATRQHAGFLVDLVESLEASGKLAPDEPIQVLELGAGSGVFATHFIKALDEGLGAKGQAIAKRLTYVMSDASEKNMTEAIQLQKLKTYYEEGRVIPAVLDLCKPMAPKSLDGTVHEGPFLAVFASYVVDVLPTKRVRKTDKDWAELYISIQTGAAFGMPATPEAILERWLGDAANPALRQTVKHVVDWRPASLDDMFDLGVHRDVISGMSEESLEKDALIYPMAFVDFLEWSSEIMHPHGVIAVADYGMTRRNEFSGSRTGAPQRYGNSLAHAVEFAVFDVYADIRDQQVYRSHEATRSVHFMVLGDMSPVAAEMKEAFGRWYDDCHDGENYLDFLSAAREARKRKDLRKAVRYLQRALDLDPVNTGLHNSLGEASLEAGYFDLAVDVLHRGRQREDAEAFDFAFNLGRAYARRNEFEKAVEWYLVSLRKEQHPVTYANLGGVYTAMNKVPFAYQSFKYCLALRPDYERAKIGMARLKELVWAKAVQHMEEELTAQTEMSPSQIGVEKGDKNDEL